MHPLCLKLDPEPANALVNHQSLKLPVVVGAQCMPWGRLHAKGILLLHQTCLKICPNMHSLADSGLVHWPAVSWAAMLDIHIH